VLWSNGPISEPTVNIGRLETAVLWSSGPLALVPTSQGDSTEKLAEVYVAASRAPGRAKA
jgi:hypothetical protein